jgi:hypothetical protein
MRAKRSLSFAAAAAAVIALMAFGATLGIGQGQEPAPAEPAPGSESATGFIRGQVTSDNRPEAGVWVIAETNSLATPYRKIVVTNGQGRYVVPELPEGRYQVWVRGYGLRDTAPAQRPFVQVGSEGRMPVANIDAQAATPQQDAANYPASYWLSLFEPPENTEALPGGRTRHEWMGEFKLSCELCHQMGATRTRGLGGNRAALDAGLHKTEGMSNSANGFGRDALLDALADWGAKNAAGRVPPRPPRPRGVERNFVITQWAWGDFYAYVHDEISTDKRNPRLYPNGKIWGVDIGNDRLLSVDPVTHQADELKVPTNTPVGWCERGQPGFSLGCPTEQGHTPHVGAYTNPARPHNPMLDDTGKVWVTQEVRPATPEAQPEFCNRDPSIRPRSDGFGYYDTNTGHFELIPTCFGTHHLQFDAQGLLWAGSPGGGGREIGWFDPSKYEEGNPDSAGEAQGWSTMVVDTNGDGQADTPAPGTYGIIPNPTDGSVWSASPGGGVAGQPGGGHIARFDPATNTHESYNPPAPGYGPRGIDVDTKGIIWTGLGGSGHLAKFDRSKCRQTWGRGGQCPEGWTLYRSPGPRIDTGPGRENVTNADFHYYIWVDQFNTLGMGRDTVILNGTGSDSLLAFNQRTEEFKVIRVPYPLNLFTRGVDGRIDDPGAGWKGRGLWFDNGLDPVLHSEIPQGYAGKVQLRPNPLAR